MVLIENEINNWRVKVYGAGNHNQTIYYQVVEEPEFTEQGDCVLIVSNHRVSLRNQEMTPVQARSLIPVYRIRGELVVEVSNDPVKYISFILPRVLKDLLDDQQIENQAGMTF